MPNVNPQQPVRAFMVVASFRGEDYPYETSPVYFDRESAERHAAASQTRENNRHPERGDTRDRNSYRVLETSVVEVWGTISVPRYRGRYSRLVWEQVTRKVRELRRVGDRVYGVVTDKGAPVTVRYTRRNEWETVETSPTA